MFGPGKVLVFGEVLDQDGTPYTGDLRSVLKKYAGDTVSTGRLHAERRQRDRGLPVCRRGRGAELLQDAGFEFVNTGGYYHSLPGDPLRLFIDTAAEVQRAMGFENEKDHPEVAPSQFEMNYGYTEACRPPTRCSCTS